MQPVFTVLAPFPCASAGVGAATILVDGAGGGGFVRIQAALDAAADGDTVLVAPGVYRIRAPLDFNCLYVPDDPGSPPVKNLVVASAQRPDATRLISFCRTQGCKAPPSAGGDY